MDRLVIGIGKTALAKEHERLLSKGLRRGKRKPSVEHFGQIEGYSEQARLGARSLWRRRMVQEHHSAAVWTRLVPQLMAAGATLDVKTTALKAALDELHHAELCAEILKALGDTPEAEVGLETRALPSHQDCSPLECVLRNMIYVGCLSETIAVAMTAEERLNAEEGLIREVLDQVHADETMHGRIGWIYLAESLPQLNEAGRERVEAYLPVAFAHLERETLAAIPDHPMPPAELHREMLALGVAENNEARALFYQTIDFVLIPQLQEFGFNAQQAWEQRDAISGQTT